MKGGRLTLHEVKERVRLGCTAEERAYPQTVVFSIELELLPTGSVTSDDLADTVDYMAVAAVVRERCSAGEWRLLEKLCFDIGSAVREISPLIRAATIKARKNIITHGEGISFELTVE